MAPRIPAGYGQITLVHTLGSDPEPMVVTVGVGPSIADEGDAVAVVGAALIAWRDEMMNNLPTQLTFIRSELHYHLPGDADDDPLRVAVSSSSTAGGEDAESVPQNTALLVHKRTALGGRAGRGRIYIPCVLESVVDIVGNLDTSYKDTITGNAIAFQASIEGNVTTPADTTLYLFHNVPAGELTAPLPTPITAWECDARVATQRRRLRR